MVAPPLSVLPMATPPLAALVDTLAPPLVLESFLVAHKVAPPLVLGLLLAIVLLSLPRSLIKSMCIGPMFLWEQCDKY